MTSEANKPIETLRDGSMKAAIWKNPGKGDKPPFYSVEITRSYKDDSDKWHDSHSFTGSELLRAARLAEIAYGQVLVLKAKDRAAADVASGGS